MDENEAIHLLKQGQISGLEPLVIRYQQKAFRTAFLILQDEQRAEDVVQEVFLRLYQRIHSYDENRPLEPYLMRSVVNSALNAAQKNHNHVPIESIECMGTLEQLLLQDSSVESQAEFAQRKEVIWNALQKLAPRQRAVIIQRYYLEMSETEMAVELDAPKGTIKWLLNAARNRLYSLLHGERSAE